MKILVKFNIYLIKVFLDSIKLILMSFNMELKITNKNVIFQSQILFVCLIKKMIFIGILEKHK